MGAASSSSLAGAPPGTRLTQRHRCAMRGRLAALCLATMHLAACASSSAQESRAAIIVDPTPASHAELVEIVSTALHGVPVTLADDALTVESVLLIERRPARDAGGQRLDGRDPGRPERFHLVKRGRQCLLIHERTGTPYSLTATQCAAR